MLRLIAHVMTFVAALAMLMPDPAMGSGSGATFRAKAGSRTSVSKD
ncbi:MAG: hypothetical protein AB9873_00555 [Syntrophobacteraceae bacterium]